MRTLSRSYSVCSVVEKTFPRRTQMKTQNRCRTTARAYIPLFKSLRSNHETTRKNTNKIKLTRYPISISFYFFPVKCFNIFRTFVPNPEMPVLSAFGRISAACSVLTKNSRRRKMARRKFRHSPRFEPQSDRSFNEFLQNQPLQLTNRSELLRLIRGGEDTYLELRCDFPIPSGSRRALSRSRIRMVELSSSASTISCE